MQSICSSLAKALASCVHPPEQDLSNLTTSLAGSATRPSDATAPIPIQEINIYFSTVKQQTGNEDIGLQAYQRAHPGNLGPLGYAIMSSPTIHCALQYIVEYHTLLATGFCLFLEDERTTLKVVGVSENPQHPPLHRTFVDAIASITLGLLHWLTPHDRIVPVLAEFSYPQPTDTRQLERLFGHNLRFSCPINALTFKKTDTALSIATYDPSLQVIHNDYLKCKNQKLTSDTVAARVKRAILQNLNQSKPLALEDISDSISITKYQLIRALDSEDLNFQIILDRTKKQFCHHLLVNTDYALKQVSYHLGFKTQSALNKACERWFQMSPSAYRKMGASRDPTEKF